MKRMIPETQTGLDTHIRFDWITGGMHGSAIEVSCRKLGQLQSLFRDQARVVELSPETLVYRVECWYPVEPGTLGGLFWGVTTIAPGKVGDEYFMTHGHFHEVADRAEFYITVRGRGALLLMDRLGRTRFEPMESGSMHYIPGGVAHRVANTGETPLVFAGCWPSDAGHDYGTIRTSAFGARMRDVNGEPVLVPEADYVCPCH